MGRADSVDVASGLRLRLLVVFVGVLSICASSLPSASASAPAAVLDEKCTILGTAGSDWIVGTSGPDVVCAGAGDDVVWGLGGNDVLYGEAGRDVLLGGDGADRLVGGAGSDVLDGAGGNDRFEPGDGVNVTFNDDADLALGAVDGEVVARTAAASSDTRCAAAEREFRCESLQYLADGFTFASVEGWLDEALFAEAAAGVSPPESVPSGREPLKGEIEAATRVRSLIGLPSEAAELEALIQNHPRNPVTCDAGDPTHKRGVEAVPVPAGDP